MDQLNPDFLTFLANFNGLTPDSMSTAPIGYEAPITSASIQEMLGAKKPDEGGAIKDILSSRFSENSGVGYGDYAQSAINSLHDKYTPAADLAQSGLMEQLKGISELTKAQYLSGGGGGNATLKAAQALMTADPSLDFATAFSIAKSGAGQGNTVVNGQVQNIGGATTAASNLSNAKQTGQNEADLALKPAIAGAETTAKNTAEVDVARQAGYTKAQSALRGLEQQANLVSSTIDNATALIDKPYSAATGYGQVFKSIPNSDSGKLNNYLNTIKANVGFDKLQSMRENSPTGGALGQISDFENKLLQAVNGALDPLQSDQLKSNLATIKTLYPQVLAERQRAFKQDYGGYAPLGNNQQPPPATPANLQPAGGIQEGATATNPTTGQKIIFRNGQWQ